MTVFLPQTETPPPCPHCQSSEIRKHGQHLGKQRWFCKSCGLAFTGDVYKRRPEDEVRPIKYENQKLLKVVSAALRMREAQNEYLQNQSGKARTKKTLREERFDKLVEKYFPDAQNKFSEDQELLPEDSD
jgi:transposase-like protein